MAALPLPRSFPPVPHCLRTTDTFKDPVLLMSMKRQNPGCEVQKSFPVTMLGPVDALISTSAFAQADVLTNHRKAMMTVKMKSWRRRKDKRLQGKKRSSRSILPFQGLTFTMS